MSMMLLVVVITSVLVFFSGELTEIVKKRTSKLPGVHIIFPLLFMTVILEWDVSRTEWVLTEASIGLKYLKNQLNLILPSSIDGNVIANLIILSVAALLPAWAYYYMMLRQGLYSSWATRYRVAVAAWILVAVLTVITR